MPEPLQRMILVIRSTGLRIGELLNLPLPESRSAQTTAPQSKVVTSADKSNKKLMSPDKLKKLSNLFNNKDD